MSNRHLEESPSPRSGALPNLEPQPFAARKCYKSRVTLPNHPRIAIDHAICGGRPTVAGTRVRVTDVLGMLAGGATEAEIVADFPYLAVEDIRACLAYAAGASGHPIVTADAAE